MSLPTLGAVVPVLDEAALLPGLLANLARAPDLAAVVVVDGGSADGSPDLARRHPSRPAVLRAAGGRHRQLEVGWRHLGTDGMVVCAADLRWPAGAFAAIRVALAAGCRCGCLRQVGSRRAWWLRATDTASRLRARWHSAPFVDQSPFYLCAAIADAGGFRARGSYDTADLARRIGGPFAALPTPVVSSCRAYADGPLRTLAGYQLQRLRRMTGNRGIGYRRIGG